MSLVSELARFITRMNIVSTCSSEAIAVLRRSDSPLDGRALSGPVYRRRDEPSNDVFSMAHQPAHHIWVTHTLNALQQVDVKFVVWVD